MLTLCFCFVFVCFFVRRMKDGCRKWIDKGAGRRENEEEGKVEEEDEE